jgi:Tfp pilus assembly protein PilO
VIKGITISAVPEELVAASASQATRQILTFNVSVIGDYLQIRQFIEDLMNSRRMILVDQINFSLANNRNQKDLGAVIRINLPYYDSQVTEKK